MWAYFVYMNICVFCSANASLDPEYFRLAAELGHWVAAEGHQLVFGGCNLGLMECVATAVKEAGGRTVGVIPTIVEKGGRVSDSCDVRVMCNDLTDRKQIMMERSDVFIALPGGIGTLDEVFSVLAMSSIGYHKKPVILYDMKGFWQPLLDLLSAMKAKGVIRSGFDGTLKVAHTLEEVKHLAVKAQ